MNQRDDIERIRGDGDGDPFQPSREHAHAHQQQRVPGLRRRHDEECGRKQPQRPCGRAAPSARAASRDDDERRATSERRPAPW